MAGAPLPSFTEVRELHPWNMELMLSASVDHTAPDRSADVRDSEPSNR